MKKIKFQIPFFKKKKTQKLESITMEGKKVILRKLKISDALFAFDTFEDHRGKCYHPFNNLKTDDDVAIYLMNFVSRYDEGKSIGWAITSSKTNEFIGMIQIPFLYPEERNCSLNFYIVQGLKKDYLEETINLVCGYLFASGLVRRIQAKIDAEDTFNEQVLKNTGFVYEGTQRKYAYYNETYHDVKMYSLLEDEVVVQEEKQ